MHSRRLAPHLSAEEAVAWLAQEPGGATVTMTTNALDSGVRCAALPGAEDRLDAALAAAVGIGATRALLWQAVGDVPEGGIIAIGGAVARSRADAMRAVDLLFLGLKGVASREDL